MKLFARPQCPYCKKKMNFMVTWLIRREGEFRCPRCGGISNIVLDAKLSIFGVLAVFTTLILFFVYRYVKNDERPELLLWLLLPIVLFYLLSFFFVRLRKNTRKRRKKAVKAKKAAEPWKTAQLDENTKIV